MPRRNGGQVRWESLFADLDAQLEAAEAAELAAEVADRSRREVGRLRLADRLRSAIGHPLVVATAGGTALAGRLAAVGPDWLLLTEIPGRETLVAAAGILSVTGLGGRSDEPGSEGEVAMRLDLRFALRGLTRGRVGVTITLVDATSVTGTLDRVGADYVELAEHPAGEPRRARDVRMVRTIPLTALAVVRST